jgi:hypothetical protein
MMKTYPGADIGSDQDLLLLIMKVMIEEVPSCATTGQVRHGNVERPCDRRSFSEHSSGDDSRHLDSWTMTPSMTSPTTLMRHSMTQQKRCLVDRGRNTNHGFPTIYVIFPKREDPGRQQKTPVLKKRHSIVISTAL